MKRINFRVASLSTILLWVHLLCLPLSGLGQQLAKVSIGGVRLPPLEVYIPGVEIPSGSQTEASNTISDEIDVSDLLREKGVLVNGGKVTISGSYTTYETYLGVRTYGWSWQQDREYWCIHPLCSRWKTRI